jgi:hypothetical protein
MKNSKLLLYCLIFSGFLIFFSCNKEELTSTNVDTEQYEELSPTYSQEKRQTQPTILGEQKENPFSVENMRIALDSLIAYAKDTESTGVNLKSASEIEILPTDLYVRFLPTDSTQYNTLFADTTLTLFDIPLDYEITQLGDYYYDPTLTTPYTWYYTTVKPGYEPPSGIKYELLSELFIVENSPDYTEEIIEDTTSTLKSSKGRAIIDQNICNALYAISFTLTGNADELPQNIDNSNSTLKSTITNCTKKCVGRSWWKVCWTSCDTYYYPDGYIKVNTPSGDVGFKGVKVRMWRWFSYTDATTDSRGYYYSRARFNKILVGNSITYKLIYECNRDNNSWTFNKSIAGAVCLYRGTYGIGDHSPNGHSMTFYTNSDYWGRAVLSNAIYDYITYANTDGISLPPSHLDIADKQSGDFTSSAPLLNSHVNWSLVYAYPNFWGVVGTIYGYSLFGWAFPDLILRYTKNMSDYEKITTIAWHELTHSSQLQRMKSEKGYLWASDYWSANVYQQASNTINSSDGRPYGKKSDTRWQIIALSEGWANYREWYLGRKYLGYNTLGKDKYGRDYYFSDYTGIPIPYGEMFDNLKNIGCSFTNMEKALCTYSIVGFKNSLIANYPDKSTLISNIVKSYE